MRRTCGEGTVRLEQIRYLVSKHADSYRRHLLEVLEWKDVAICDFLRANRELERNIEIQLVPRLAARRRERTARGQDLESAICAMERDNASLREAAAHAHAELDALRASMSWKVTRPARVIYGWLRQNRGVA